MKKTALVIVTLGLGTISCSRELRIDVQPHPDRDGTYLVDYWPWERVLDQYGQGAEKVRQHLKATGYANAEATWDKAFEEAVPRLLEAKGLIPSQCADGIVILSSGEAEGGNGTAVFRCK